MAEVFIGIGSNVGPREENIRRAIVLLSQKAEILSVSSMYETEPMYLEGQRWFINCVVKAKTKLTPREFLKCLKQVEVMLGREEGERYGPRTIDLDLLLYGDQVVSLEGLAVPHARLRERGFVLVPLVEIEPDLVVPSTGRTVSQLLKELHCDKQVRKLRVEPADQADSGTASQGEKGEA